MKDEQAAREASNPQQTSSTKNNKTTLRIFLFLWDIFAYLDSAPDPTDQNQCGAQYEKVEGNKLCSHVLLSSTYIWKSMKIVYFILLLNSTLCLLKLKKL